MRHSVRAPAAGRQRRSPPSRAAPALVPAVRPPPAVFGLTVVALTGGLASLVRNNRQQSQLMMRARVFFQFCTVSALVGGIYSRAYQGTLNAPDGSACGRPLPGGRRPRCLSRPLTGADRSPVPYHPPTAGKPTTDKRVFLSDPRELPALESTAGAGGADAGGAAEELK
jgi:hypothetical protein